jgi:dolichyl-phosphate-mannose-protein mannosyltransferase
MEIRRNLSRLHRWEYFWLFLIVLATFIMHLCIITSPSQPIFDEIHYVNDARNIIVSNETLRAEHPPLAKLFFVAGEYIFNGFKSPLKDAGTMTLEAFDSTNTIIDVSDASVFNGKQTIRIDTEHMEIQSIDTSLNQITVNRGVGTNAARHDAQQEIYVFDDNPWGWRLLPISFGTATIVLFYFLCRRLNMSRDAASIATFLLALENMTFVQASVAMLDVYCLTFMMASFLLYASRRYLSAGVGVALAALAKLNGALAAPVMFFHWLFRRQGRSRWFTLTVVMAPVAFIGLMLLFDFAIVRDLSALVDPISRIKTMLSLSSSLTFATVDHPCLSRPWEWLINYEVMGYWYTPHYLSAISPSIWALIMPTFGYMVYRAVKGSGAGLFGAAWFTGTYLVWIPLSLITDRASYIYYFYPTVGAICLGLGLGLSQLLEFYRQRRPGKLKKTVLALFIFYLVFHLACFMLLGPFFPTYWPW